jgi:citrate/tricarballylate utilization protein
MGQTNPGGDFYSVVPHYVMVAVFGAVFVFFLTAIGIATTRFWRDLKDVLPEPISISSANVALRDALSLRHLHSTGVDCPGSEEVRTPWRRWFHHCTFYGFMLCFASTTVAAIYDGVFAWRAPYGYTSVPVVLGTLGGLGLLAGPWGLLHLKGKRDAALADPGQQGLDESFLTLLLLTSGTGLLLLVLRNGAWMPPLLIVHLSVVLALFLTLPYGKFVHGFYRTAALIKYAAETTRNSRSSPPIK